MQELIPNPNNASGVREEELQQGAQGTQGTQGNPSGLTVAEEILSPQYQRRRISLGGVPTEQRQIIAIRELSETLPLNDMGLPYGIYRPDFLPVHKERGDIRTPEERSKDLIRYNHESGEFESAWDGSLPTYYVEVWIREEYAKQKDLLSGGDVNVVVEDAPSFAFTRADLRAAWLQLDYKEGYPRASRGTPFWQQLDFEPPEAFMAFEAYLTLTVIENRGVREMRYVPDVMNHLARQSGLPLVTLPSEEQLEQYYTLYYWYHRTKAYDLFRAVEFRRKQEERAYETLDDHYFRSRKMLDRLQEYMDDEEEFWSLMTPKVAIDLMKVLVGMQRVSVGLPAGTPLPAPAVGKDGVSRGTPITVEGMMRMLAQQDKHAGVPLVTSGTGDGDADGGGGVAMALLQAQRQEMKMLIAKMLTDPEATEKAQDLIIAMMSAPKADPT